MTDIILSLNDTCKEYIQGTICLEVLKNINLNVKKGEVAAIMGQSGSGKSTLLQIAGLLDIPTYGKVFVSGVDSSLLSVKEMAEMRLRKIGFIYQSYHLLRDFSARENAAMPALVAGENYDKAVARADEYLERLGMEARRFHFPGQLSGGEQQRVAIARSMFNNPEIILADEPTGNLDPETGENVFKMFLDLARSQNTAAIIVTHNPEIAKNADKLYLLKSGFLEGK